MNNSKMTKRALLTSIMALALCFAMLTGTTFAWFTDQETSANNKIIAGNLDVELLMYDAAEGDYVDIGKNESPIFGAGSIAQNNNAQTVWEPGKTQVAYLAIKNAGNLAIKYSVELLVEDIAKAGETEGSKLYEVMEYAIIPDAQPTAVAAWNGGVAPTVGTQTVAADVSLEVGATHYFALAIHMLEEADNKYQNAEADFDLKVYATQLMAESDAFGPDYDEDSTYQYTSSEIIGGGESLVAGDVTITLPENAAQDNYTAMMSNKKVETNANGETVVSVDITLLKNGVKVEATAGTEYDVVLDIGKNVVVTGLTHNGEAITSYSYDPTTGLISFKTDSFSPFAVSFSDEVTKINSAEDLINVLTDIKTEAKLQIPGETGNKAYRENAILVLENDIVIDSSESFMYTDSNGAPLHFYGVRGILDLNGHSITVESDALLSGKAHANAAILVQYSNISIIGEGSIITENKSIPVYAWANCTVDIYGGNYVSNAPERNESAVYVNNATALVNVYGGTYTDTKYAFNVHDNCGTNTTIILHEGIEFADFLKSGTTDVIASDIKNGRIAVAEGCALEKYEENGVSMNKVVIK